MFKIQVGIALAIGVVASSIPNAYAGSRSRPVCGWYVVAGCVQLEEGARALASKGWGSVINTDYYEGFQPGYFCVVSGPQSKASAVQDRRNSIADGISPDAYIKRACTDTAHSGD